MIQTYTVTGMTCNGCKESVEKKLKQVKDVVNVSVNLEAEEATITMLNPIETNALEEALTSKYSIAKKKTIASNKKSHFEKTPSKMQQLKPLFLIFGFVIVTSTAINYHSWNTTNTMLDFMGLFFLVFSLFKFFDLKGFATSFAMYDPIAKRSESYGIVYPFLEAILGVLLLLRVEVKVLLIATIIILGITTIGVTKSLLSKSKIKCACLGTTLNLPMTEATFIENAIMITMAIVLLFNTVAI